MESATTPSEVMAAVSRAVDRYRASVDQGPIAPTEPVEQIRSDLAANFSFDGPIPATDLIEMVASRLSKWQVHTPHRRYWGLFNPDTRPVTTAADALVAAFNPQLAAWSHSPGAAEMERHVLRVFTRRFGWDTARSFESFTSGGAEANLVGLLAGLTEKLPEFAERGSPGGVRIYVSQEAHHSLVKIAHIAGIGRSAICEIEVDQSLGMIPERLLDAVRRDRASGLRPTAVVATVGTTAAGASDPVAALRAVADQEGLWLHADAAWAGTAILSERLRPHLAGIELADSITADAHKWMSVPMGAGMSFVKEGEISDRVFAIQTQYMPANEGAPDPYTTTPQWSRRFIGLKVFMALAETGIEGFARQIERQAQVGRFLRSRLQEEGWLLVNDSPFAVVCFTRPGIDPALVAQRLRERQQAWISHTRLTHFGTVLRACVTNYRSDESDVEALIAALREAAG